MEEKTISGQNENCDALKESKPELTDNQKRFLEVLKSFLGIVSPAADQAGITPQTHYRWMHESPTYAEAVKEIKNRAIDFVESKLIKNIKDGDPGQICFYLKCQGKERGWVERSELNLSGEVATVRTAKEYIAPDNGRGPEPVK
jgi:hypothetical protein